MTRITSRPYTHAEDFQTMLDLMARVRPAEHLYDYPVRVDIEENLASGVIRSNTRLWFDGDLPIAWAYVDTYNNLRLELDRQYEDRIGAETIEWCMSCIRRMHGEEGSSALDASCREDYRERIAFLKQHGFRQLQDTTIYMVRPLSMPIPEPELPPGFIIRPVAGKHEAEAVAAMHRAAFGTENMTTENRLIIMSTSEYDPSLDLIVTAPGGPVAANCICSLNEERRVGFTDPLSTHPRFQRMGLARALLLAGMRLLKERGMASAHLGTSGSNLAMQKTAESVGFRIESTNIWFSKEVN